MQLIGINGLKTSGKDTAFRLLKESTELRVERAGFADKLKIMAARALGFERWDEELIALMDSFKDDSIFEIEYREPGDAAPSKRSLTGRQYLQWFGGNARKVFGDTFWVDQVLPPEGLTDEATQRALQARYPTAQILCITDVRYPNEAERVLKLGGVVWEIQRPGLESDGHDSEQPLPSELVTHTIKNNGSIDDLRKAVFCELNA